MVSITVKRITTENQSDVRAMETGIENDYVLHILSDLIETKRVYGAYYKHHLVGMAGYSVFANDFVILGRLRTAINYRGQGIATDLLKQIIKQLVKDSPHVEWIGLTTLDENIPVHHIAQSLGLLHITTYYSCIMTLVSKERAKKHNMKTDDWQVVTSLQQKQKYLQLWLPTPVDNVLGMFPYEVYYPLIQDTRLLEDTYLRKCHMLVYPEKQRLVMLMPDYKGERYFQVKYFWDDLIKYPELIMRLKNYAFEHHRYLWIDLPESTYENFHKDMFSSVSKWRLYGQKSCQLKDHS